MNIRAKKTVAAVALGAAGIAGAGVAYAAWTSGGAGTGSARSTTSDESVIAAVTLDATNDLYPGAVKSAYVTISNPNDYPVVVTAISGGSSRAAGDCAADAVRTDAVAAADGIDQDGSAGAVIAGNGSGTYELTLRMSNSAGDDCKDKTFTLGLLGAPGDAMTASLKSAASTSGNGF